MRPPARRSLLGHAAAKGRDIPLDKHWVKSRDGHTGARKEDGAIGFATLRGGTVVGEHSVIFAGSGERITLSHSGRRPHHLSPMARWAPPSGAMAGSRVCTP